MSHNSRESSSLTLPPADRLSSLNHDVLCEIFDHLQAGSTNSGLLETLCMSKKLLRYTRRALYYEVRFKELESLMLFVRTVSPVVSRQATLIEPGGSVASMVKIIKIDWTEELADQSDSRWTTFTPAELFRSLPGLEEIDVSFCPHLARFLNSEAGANSFTCLRRLSLTGHVARSDHANPISEACFLGLRSYQTLSSLYLYLLDEESITWIFYQGLRPPPQSTFALRQLTLDVAGVDTVTDYDIATFLRYFVNLEKLSLGLMNWKHPLSIGQILGGAGSGLTYLDVRLYDDEEEEVQQTLADFGSALSNFPILQTLKLQDHACIAISILAAKRCDMLKILHLATYRPLPHRALNQLLLREAGPPPLEEIILDNWDHFLIQNGTPLELLSALPGAPGHVGWKLPKWPADFSFNEATAFAMGCREVGITVSGSLIKAIRIQTEWNEGIAALEKRVAASAEEILSEELAVAEDVLLGSSDGEPI